MRDVEKEMFLGVWKEIGLPALHIAGALIIVLLLYHGDEVEDRILDLERLREVDVTTEIDLNHRVTDLEVQASIVKSEWPWPEDFSPCGPLFCDHLNKLREKDDGDSREDRPETLRDY